MCAGNFDRSRRQVDANRLYAVLCDEGGVTTLMEQRYSVLSEEAVPEGPHASAACNEGFSVLERVERDSDILPPFVEQFSKRGLDIAGVPRSHLLLPRLFPSYRSSSVYQVCGGNRREFGSEAHLLSAIDRQRDHSRSTRGCGPSLESERQPYWCSVQSERCERWGGRSGDDGQAERFCTGGLAAVSGCTELPGRLRSIKSVLSQAKAGSNEVK